jgi:hypothetical protein
MKFGLVTLLAAVFLLSCEDGGGKNDYNLNYREPMVWGLLSKVWDDEQAVSYQKDFGVFDFDGLRMVPIVLLNDSQVEPYYYSPTEYDYGDTNVIPTNRKYDLEVRHYWGTGFCHLVMPGDFALTLPPRVPFDTFMLRQDASLLTAWSASQGAQWYWLSVYVNYDFYDTLGAWDNREFRLDTLMHDTWIIVPPQQMFPPVVREVIEGDASVTVWSGNGPPVEPATSAVRRSGSSMPSTSRPRSTSTSVRGGPSGERPTAAANWNGSRPGCAAGYRAIRQRLTVKPRG